LPLQTFGTANRTNKKGFRPRHRNHPAKERPMIAPDRVSDRIDKITLMCRNR
jgi:hypothetical protein